MPTYVHQISTFTQNKCAILSTVHDQRNNKTLIHFLLVQVFLIHLWRRPILCLSPWPYQ